VTRLVPYDRPSQRSRRRTDNGSLACFCPGRILGLGAAEKYQDEKQRQQKTKSLFHLIISHFFSLDQIQIEPQKVRSSGILNHVHGRDGDSKKIINIAYAFLCI
jgi:hypothetical protein